MEPTISRIPSSWGNDVGDAHRGQPSEWDVVTVDFAERHDRPAVRLESGAADEPPREDAVRREEERCVIDDLLLSAGFAIGFQNFVPDVDIDLFR